MLNSAVLNAIALRELMTTSLRPSLHFKLVAANVVSDFKTPFHAKYFHYRIEKQNFPSGYDIVDFMLTIRDRSRAPNYTIYRDHK